MVLCVLCKGAAGGRRGGGRGGQRLDTGGAGGWSLRSSRQEMVAAWTGVLAEGMGRTGQSGGISNLQPIGFTDTGHRDV